MALVRNDSPYPVKMVSYQVGNTRFGKEGGTIYPGECRYINAENYEWDYCLITAFTPSANPPGGVELAGGSVGLPSIGSAGVSVAITNSDSIAAMTIGKHHFGVFYQKEDGLPGFRLLEQGEDARCRLDHGW